MYKIYKHSSNKDPDRQMQKTIDDFGALGVSPGYASGYLGISRQSVDHACKRGALRACRILQDDKLIATLIDTKSLKAYKELRELTGSRVPFRSKAI